MTKDKMVGWHHQLNGLEFEQTLGGGEGQGSLACCHPWDHEELDTTEQMNNRNISYIMGDYFSLTKELRHLDREATTIGL